MNQRPGNRGGQPGRNNYQQNRGPQLPRSFFDPIERHEQEEFGHWGCAYDWTSWNGAQVFADKRDQIEAARPGGFRLIAHTALQLVIKPLVTSGKIPQEAYDDLEAICERVAGKVIEAKREEDARRAKEKSEAEARAAKAKAGDPTKDAAEVNRAVSAVLQAALYSFIREPLEAHWNKFVGSLGNERRAALHRTLCQMDEAQRQLVIKDLMQMENADQRIQVAADRGLLPS